MKPNFNNYSDIMALDFLLNKSVLTTVVFYTQRKTHRIDESFPMKPSLEISSLIGQVNRMQVVTFIHQISSSKRELSWPP